MSGLLDRSSACAGCISRRAFLADSAALAAIAALAAACTDATAPGRKFDPLTIKVADFPGLATANRLVTPDIFRAVKRTGDATFAAFSLSCTHQGTTVGLVNATTFSCPNHGSKFDNNGQVTLGPAEAPLFSLTTAYDAESDMLTIGGTN